jgi:hypothetical protein
MLGNFEALAVQRGLDRPAHGKLSRSRIVSCRAKIAPDALTIAYRTSYFVHRDTSTARPY